MEASQRFHIGTELPAASEVLPLAPPAALRAAEFTGLPKPIEDTVGDITGEADTSATILE